MDKPKEERVQEGIVILKKLIKLGIDGKNAGFREIKEAITEWINTGIACERTIPIPRYDRDAEMILPSARGRVASILLKVIPSEANGA